MDIDYEQAGRNIPGAGAAADQSRTHGLAGSVGYTPSPYSCASEIDQKIGWHLDQINQLRDVKRAVEGMGWMPDLIHRYIARSLYP